MMRLRTEGLSWQRIDDHVVVLDLEGSSYLRLNATGAVLWEALAAGTERDALVRLLTERHDVDAGTAARDVDTFLADVRAAGLLAEA
jgi:hypothetical protein